MIETAILSMTGLKFKVALGSNIVGRDGPFVSVRWCGLTIRGSLFWARYL